MGWLISGLMDILISLAGDLISFFLSIFADFSIDIGYNPDAPMNGLFSPTYYRNATGLLDRVFPIAQNFFSIFMVIGYVLVGVIMLFKLMQAMLGPVSSNAESPAKIVANTVLASIGVTYSYTLFILMERVANSIYGLFKEQFAIITEYGMPNVIDYIVSPDRLFKNQSLLGLSELGLTLVMLFVFVTMIIQFAKLILEAYERYVILGLLFYTCPLAFATLSSESTKKIFGNWTQMVVSQFLIMMMNLFFIGGFYASFIYVFSPVDPTFLNALTSSLGINARTYVFADGADFIAKMFLLIGWLVVGQKVDEHLRSLGLSASQSGHGLGAALMGGAVTTKQILQSASKLVSSASRTAEKVNKGRETAARNDAETARNQRKAENFSKPLADKGKLQQGQTGAGYRENGIARKNGSITKDGAYGVMNAPKEADGRTGITFGTKDTKETMEQLGINPKDKYSGLLPNSLETTDGLITAKDSEGKITRQLGDQDRYKVPGNAAELQHQTPHGTVIEPAMQHDINEGSTAMMAKLMNTSGLRNEDGIAWQAGRNDAGELDGTAIGYKSDEDGKIIKDENGYSIPMYQAKLDQVADFDDSLGAYAQMKNSDNQLVDQKGLALGNTGMTYSVQDISNPENGQHVHETGFDNIKPAAQSPLLEAKNKAESDESVMSHDKNAVSKLMQNEAALADLNMTPSRAEDGYTKFGRVINDIAGSKSSEGARSYNSSGGASDEPTTEHGSEPSRTTHGTAPISPQRAERTSAAPENSTFSASTIETSSQMPANAGSAQSTGSDTAGPSFYNTFGQNERKVETTTVNSTSKESRISETVATHSSEQTMHGSTNLRTRDPESDNPKMAGSRSSQADSQSRSQEDPSLKTRKNESPYNRLRSKAKGRRKK